MPVKSQPTLAHRLQYGVLRVVESVLRVLPLKVVFGLGSALGLLIHFAWRKQRVLVRRSVEIAFQGEKSAEELDDLTRESFKLTCGNLLSSLALPFHDIKKIRERVEIEGNQLVLDALAQEKGVIVLIPHMGNWELLAQVVGIFEGEFEVATHYRPLNNPLVNDLIEKRRKAKGLQLFAKKTSSHQLCAFLRENKILSILADQRLPSKGDLCSFFGRPTACSPLPSLLAKRTDSVLLGLHCETLGPDRWKLTLTEVQGRDSQACADNLEAAWRSSPADVFWFQERWKLNKRQPLRFLQQGEGPGQALITQPLKLKVGDSLAETPDLPVADYLYEWVEEGADLVVEQEHLDQLKP